MSRSSKTPVDPHRDAEHTRPETESRCAQYLCPRSSCTTSTPPWPSTPTCSASSSASRILGDYRWLLVGFPGQPDFALNLDLATTEEQRYLVGRQAADLPLFSIDTDDCENDYQRLRAQGVTFDSEPGAQPYGTGVMLRDLYNNRIYLNQEPSN